MSLLILLPPSEGKSTLPGTGPTFAQSCPEFAADTEALVKRLRRLPKKAHAATYGVSTPEKAAAAHALNLVAPEAPGSPAIARYTGVVYDFLDYPTLSVAARTRADTSIFIVSALFGLIPATASIPNYKLPMSASLATQWRAINTQRLQNFAHGRTVISLLPGAHAKALAGEVLPIDFRLEGGKKSAGHFGKAIKGRFVRFLIDGNVQSVEEFHRFREDDYRFDGSNFLK